MTTGPQKLQDLSNHEDNSKSLWKLPSGQHVVVSRVLAMDHGGWETMIFRSDNQGKVKNFQELYGTRRFESHSQSNNNLMKETYV